MTFDQPYKTGSNSIKFGAESIPDNSDNRRWRGESNSSMDRDGSSERVYYSGASGNTPSHPDNTWKKALLICGIAIFVLLVILLTWLLTTNYCAAPSSEPPAAVSKDVPKTEPPRSAATLAPQVQPETAAPIQPQEQPVAETVPVPQVTLAPAPKTGYFGTLYIGDTVSFGSYEQDGNSGNGAEAIEWIVVGIEGDRALLLSKYCLDAKKLNEGWVDTTWENCSLRAWMNGTFFSSAFSPEEANFILMSSLSNPNNPDYGTYGGPDTNDHVFALSLQELEGYVPDYHIRQAKSTAYAMKRGAPMNPDNAYSWWWLRTPGEHVNYAVAVYSTGIPDTYGLYDRCDNGQLGGVRPAMWVDIG